jgi:hypothetical protein
MSSKSQYRKQNRRKSLRRMQILTRRIEDLSVGVPKYVLDTMQIEAVAWSIPEWVKLGPSQPSEAEVIDLLERSAEAQLDRLQAYWKEVAQNV